MIQKEYFPYESNERLKRMKHVQDILRVKTKIMHAQDNMNFSTTVFGFSNHEAIKRLILHFYLKNSHAGSQIFF